MKKIFALLLALLMTISMVACGKETTSADNYVTSKDTSTKENTNIIIAKDELLADAERTDVGRLLDSEDIGKAYVVWGIPTVVADSYCVISAIYKLPMQALNAEFKVSMSEEDLSILDAKEHAVKIVGIIDDVTIETVGQGAGAYENAVISLSNGYYVGDELEICGKIYKFNGNAVRIEVDNTASEIALKSAYDNVLVEIPFTRDIVETLKKGDIISVKGNLEWYKAEYRMAETPLFTLNNAELLNK